MSGRFLLDTNIIIALFANDPLVQENLERAEEVFVSSITIGELYYGAYFSNRIADNIARIQEFASRNTILVCDLITSQCYGQIKNRLKVKGRPLPENDIWIAAIAQQYQLTLVSRDKHFREIDNLSVETW
jgi:tRNA(fMet)-specific endonuclease VapC